MTLTLEEKRARVRDLLTHNKATAGAVGEAGRALAEIPEEYYRFELWPAYKSLLSQRDTMARIRVANPYFRCHTDVSRDTLRIDDRDYLNFSGYNYVGLSGDAELDAAIKSVCETMKADHDKSRVAFYYLVADKLGKLSALA